MISEILAEILFYENLTKFYILRPKSTIYKKVSLG
jgi:hypothetical protein